MSESNVSDQVIEWVTRFFPEWIEEAEKFVDDLSKIAPKEGVLVHDGSEKTFASFMTMIYREKKGTVYEIVAEKDNEIADYLIAVKDSGLSDEEIRWELISKLGGVD